MSLPRVFTTDKLTTPGSVFALGQADSAHLVAVLRLQLGDEFEVVDGAGRLFSAIFRAGDAKGLSAELLRPLAAQSEPRLRVVLVQGLPKGDKMELVVQKATELGVTEIVPLDVSHTVVRYTGDKAVKKVERWQKIAREAATQADRLVIPRVWRILTLPDLEKDQDFWQGLHLMAWEGSCASLKTALRQAVPAPERVVIYVGPEGSFSTDEREGLFLRGVAPISLGPRILRTETAGLALLSMIMYEFDQIIPQG